MIKKLIWIAIVVFLALLVLSIVDTNASTSLEHKLYLPVVSVNYTNIPRQTGEVTGRFLFAGEPAPEESFFVATCDVIGTDGNLFCAYDIFYAPRVLIQADGTFDLPNVGYGWQGIVMDFVPGVTSPIMPHNPDTGKEITFQLLNGHLDLGTFAYDDSWPIDGLPVGSQSVKSPDDAPICYLLDGSGDKVDCPK